MATNNYFIRIAIILGLSISSMCVINSSYFLPKDVTPIRYLLTMEPHFESCKRCSWFNGTVKIELKTLETTNNITLHVRNLNITKNSIRIERSNGSELNVLSTSTNRRKEFYTINLEDELIKNELYNLTIEDFRGSLNYDNVGFYLAKYEDENGNEKILAVTDFEASDARKAFPCFDEPAMKARFTVRIVRPSNYTTVSNQPLHFTEDLRNGKHLDTFKETVEMSTYLVAFLVSEFKHTERKGIHQIFARETAIEQGKLDYALTQSGEMLQALEGYTGINYTSDKLDLVAIPDEYFTDEAMENWGMVTFSEKHLFISNDTSTTEDKQRCATYIAHEFAHQWFGNLVTFKEWKYMWLSEGFGSYFQYYISSTVHPSWRLMDQFILDVIQGVLEYDRTLGVQPLNYQPHSIGSIPSPWICYYKASGVINMIRHFLTDNIFQEGLRIYLNKYKFSAAEPLYLYEAFQEAVDRAQVSDLLLGNNSVPTILSTWDSNPGHPLVTVTRNYEDGSVMLSQERDSYEANFVSNHTWYIPITLVSEQDSNRNFSDTTADFWLTDKTMIVDKNISSDEWLLINKQQTGFYRVNYDLNNWNKIAAFLNSDKYHTINVINRAQLLYEAFNLAQENRIPFYIPLNLTKYLVKETDYIVLKSFHKSIDFFDKIMTSSPMYEVFQDYIVNIFSTAYDSLGFDEKENEPHLDKFNRKVVVKWLCKYGHYDCRNRALNKLKEWKTDGKFNVSLNLYKTVLCQAIRTASIEEWEFLYSQLEKYKDRETDIIMALGCSENVDILKNYLNKINSSSNFSSFHERVAIISIINSGSVGLTTAFDYLIQNHDNLRSGVHLSLSYDIGERLTTESQLKELKKLPYKYFMYSEKMAKKNLEWINKGYLKDVEEWLIENNLNKIELSNVR